jgi:hypothetical protein
MPVAPAPLLVAAAVLAHMEGRGHTCLSVAELCQPPVALLGWPAAAVDGAQGLKALWAHLPATLADWQAALQGHSPSVGVRLADAPDQGQPLVLGGSADAPLLYLRRYAGYEQRVGQSLLQRASEPLAVPEAAAREWLDRFFVPNPEAPNPQATTSPTGKKWPAPWRCGRGCRSSRVGPAPARPTPPPACWRCCWRCTPMAARCAWRWPRPRARRRRA